MKKQWTILKLMFLFLCGIQTSSSFAQFTPTSLIYPEVAAGATGAQPRNTGNDILFMYQGGYGQFYRVNVWDPNGSTTALAWNVDVNSGGTITNYQGTVAFSLTSGIFDPDVCIITDGTNVYAVAVYYEIPTNIWYWEGFHWNGSAFTSLGANAIATGSFGTTAINIDGNENGEFVIVYDDNSNIRVMAGDLTGSPFNTYGVVTIGGETSPDVAICYGGGLDAVHVASIDGNGDLIENSYLMSDLIANTPVAYAPFVVSPGIGLDFHFPRISSPEVNSSNGSEWSIVVEENDGSGIYNIIGFNAMNTTPIIYNFTAYDLTCVQNVKPCITYDSKYPTDGVWVGWTFDNTSYSITATNAIDAYYTILVKCDNAAQPLTGYTYWQIPDNVISSDYSDCLSMSGRFSFDELYLTYASYINNHITIDDVISKDITVAAAASSCKILNNNQIVQNNYSFLGNEIINIKVFDLSGKTVLDFKSNAEVLKTDIHSSIQNLKSSFYILQMTNEKMNFFKSQKIFVSNFNNY